MNKIVIPLDNGYKLIAEQNIGSEYDKELFVGIESDRGAYVQDLAVIRPSYKLQNESIKFDSDKFEILVYGDEKQEDYTNKFTVLLCQNNDE